MDLKSWRIRNKLTLAEMATKLHLCGPNPARNLQRIETGENRADADLVAAIDRATKGAVTAADMNITRLAWLQANGRAKQYVPEPQRGRA